MARRTMAARRRVVSIGASCRASTIARIEGSDSSRAPLLIHGHLDVVPAAAFDDDGTDPGAMQQMRKEQSGRAGANYEYFGVDLH